MKWEGSVLKKGTKLSLVGLAAGVGAAGGLAAMGNTLYNQVMLPVPRDPAQDAREPASQQEGRRWARAAEGFQSVSIRSVEGLELWGALCPAGAQSHRWVICLHGYKDDHTAMGACARRYHDCGWNVLMPDQRGCGNSQGDFVGWGFSERLDLVSWISWVTRRDAQAEILLHGVSMGAATVLMATGGALPGAVKAAVSDCSYANIEAEMRHMVDDSRAKSLRIPPVPSALLFSLLRSAVQRRAGFDLRDAAPVEAVERSRIPTLFIHGTRDKVVPPAMMSRLFQAARCPKSFLWIPEAGHAAAVGTDPQLYWSGVDTFIQPYFSTGETA